MIVDRRVYRTVDGELTLDLDRAAFLAAAPGDELPDDQVAELRLGQKAKPSPANKARRAAANKAGSGQDGEQ